jgi:hypothetical protein
MVCQRFRPDPLCGIAGMKDKSNVEGEYKGKIKVKLGL